MTRPPLLRVRGLRKNFGGVAALRGVDFEAAAGEVHALLGENGAGKSTLLEILAGTFPADAGTLEFDGAPYAPRGPREARERGIATIHQELTLAPHLSIHDNVMLGREGRRGPFVDRGGAAPRVRAALAELGRPDLEPERRVDTLSPGERQLVEIARALAGAARLLVLDEPTSSLSRADAERLFAVLERLRARGVAVIYVSHYLEEVARIAQRFTVLRDGESVGSGPIAGTPLPRLVELMAGRPPAEVFPRFDHMPGDVVLRLEELRGTILPLRATLELRRGEILGLAGLVGAGRTELLRALFGLAPVASGRITIATNAGALPDGGASPRRRLAQRVGLLSEDRKLEGLALRRTLAENATWSDLDPFTRAGFVDVHARDAATARLVERLRIRCRGPAQRVGELSGGNQQKVALARLLHQDADVLLLDEPTRGIDVRSKAEIHAVIGALAARGKAVLLVSSYAPELLGVCDRIAVMHRGVLGPARARADWTETSLLDAATRGEEAAA